MSSQSALWLNEKHGAFAIGPSVIPSPSHGEILVKVHSIGLNPVDWKIQDLGLDVGYPAILGHEAAGTVEALGEGVSQFGVGDRVLHEGTVGVRTGAFQQYVAIPAAIAAKIPAKISFDQAATIPLGIATATVPLYTPAPLGIGYQAPWNNGGRERYAGHPVLVLGGSSSVGQYAIQLLRLSGFSPILTTASPVNAPLLTSLGATHVIDRHLPFSAIANEVSALTSGAPVKLVYDAVSLPDTQQGGYDILARGGYIIVTMRKSIKEREGEGKHVVPVDSDFHVPANMPFGAVVMRELPALLEGGDVVPTAVEVVPGGLGGIVSGLERLRNYKVSARKLVVHPWEGESA
ncbi:GroES-like protein [Leucogyrophana mollusca]|uniref:GroES-like protein n=1 Tax=Leucogyrophana mollusca TaxID=85980 RepID=A0ACB8BAE9_9AGAM|nr:GroES-like protein [Leucogyrophana mollusca]